MPKTKDREYRTMASPLATMGLEPEAHTKRFNTDFYVEGFATTFDTPYIAHEWDGVRYYEVVDKNAFIGADFSDVIMQYDHAGIVYARNKMAMGKPATLIIEPQERGLFIAADLGVIEEAKSLYASIEAGLIYKMSWAFRVAEDKYNKETRTRTITKIKKVFDVSAVHYPVNAGTDISVRSYFDGVIEIERREALERDKKLALLKLKLEV